MQYWKDNNFDSLGSENIVIIKNLPAIYSKNLLPPNFGFKQLGVEHLDEIHSLLSKHYMEDIQHTIKIVYSKDFLYWYIKHMAGVIIIGLVYTPLDNKKNKKLVGLISSIFVDMVIYDKQIKIPYVNLLCLQSRIRSSGLAEHLMDEMKKKLQECQPDGEYCFFTSMKKLFSPICETNDFIVPINYSKLKEIGFVADDEAKRSENNNDLHLMVDNDLATVVPGLNRFNKKYSMYPYLTIETAKHLLVPKKNIVYSFVIKNDAHLVTDFVSIYQHYYYCVESKKMIKVAQLALYFYETMSMTELISQLVDKLKGYNFDLLVFRNLMDNQNINITKFSTFGELNYYLYNVSIKGILPDKMCCLPF